MTGTTTSGRSTGVGSDASGGETAMQKTQSAVGTATTKAKETGSDLTHKASDQVEHAKHELVTKADDRKGVLADQARTLQEKLAEFATSVSDEQPKVGEAIEMVSSRASNLIDWVEQTPVEEMTRDLNTQLKRHPMLFAAGLFGAGFALTRVLKPVDPSLAPASTGSRQLGAGSPYDGSVH